ncbi:hypothetical protein [Pseudomonas sp.]|uniref:hypothetical protein n=1 Tax=Pseudomonas sp. TaxID=306 RepID=UPI00290E242D|nr:hypothetical protein [Pseudomonas sp.]MDU4254553.1 hypothetical protein [Pseudomonas sp.]
MSLIRQGDDPANSTPSVFSNSSGLTSWSGRHVSELSGSDVVAILEYCTAEGYRRGWNDAHNDQVQEPVAAPFHADLLGGYPAREWTASYWDGVDEQRNPPMPEDGPLPDHFEAADCGPA